MLPLLHNFRYALRQLRKSPGFALTVILTLSLGLGATAAMFTVVDRVMLRPLPYQDAQQIVQIHETGLRGARDGAPFLDIQQWRETNHTLVDIAFYKAYGQLSFLEGSSSTVQVMAPRISANLFPLLGVSPIMGREFESATESVAVHPDDAQNILLSDTVWRTIYAADPAILGKTVHLSGEPYTVIGVMPRAFTFPFGESEPTVWRALVLDKADAIRVHHDTPDYIAIARLKPSATVSATQAELKTVQADVSNSYSDLHEREEVNSVEVLRYSDTIVDTDVKKALLALSGAALVLWLIACLNATSLLLARAVSRQREIAVRGALGASRSQIIGQLLSEGLLLSTIASLVGVVLAVTATKLFERALTTQLNIHTTLTPSLSVIGILLALTILSALVSSVWPATASARKAIEPVLRQGSAQAGASRNQHRTRSVLVVSEIALSLTLLIACGLLLRTIYALRHVPLGFKTDHIIVASMTIPSYRFTGLDMQTHLYQPLIERVQHLPGVEAATLLTEVPLGKHFQLAFTFYVEGDSEDARRQRNLSAQFRAVGPEMQRVFGFRMREGRFFNEHDTATSQPVLVVNRAFVKAFVGDDQHLAKFLGQPLIGLGKDRMAAVVGVLDDERQVSVAEPSEPEIEVCIPQITPDTGFYQDATGMAMSIAIRTERRPVSIVPEIRQLMREASPELASAKFSTMDQIVEDSYGSQQLAARLLQIFGGCALLLCVAGIYGLLVYLVTQRTRELGLRIALGAQRGNVMWLILRQAGWMLVAGSSIGLVLAYFSSRLLEAFLYGVKPHDPWLLTSVTLFLIATGLAAACIPARRAAVVDPMEALRAE